jgi:hypothetical protein
MFKDKSEMPEIVKQLVADTALFRKDYPSPLCSGCLRRDNAQNGKTGNHIKVLCNIARTDMVASGLCDRYLARAIFYAADISNVQY